MYNKGFIRSNIIFSFILLLFLFIFSALVYQHYAENSTTKEWLNQNVTVLDSLVIESKCGKGSSSVCHCAVINVNVRYSGQNFHSNLETQDNCFDAEHQIKSYPKNREVVVFVNQKNPRETRSLDFVSRSPPYILMLADIFILLLIFFLVKRAFN